MACTFLPQAVASRGDGDWRRRRVEREALQLGRCAWRSALTAGTTAQLARKLRAVGFSTPEE